MGFVFNTHVSYNVLSFDSKLRMDKIPLSPVFTFSKRRRPQILAAFTASIGIFTHGMIASWSSTAVPSLVKDEYFPTITLFEQSWIISLAPFAAFLSAPISGISVDHCGRKMTMIVQAVLLIIGMSMTTFAQSVEMLYAGRFIAGISIGAAVFAPVVYISDISEQDIRGRLSSCGQIMPAIGTLFSYTSGSFLGWRWQTFVSTVPPLLYLILLIVVPESPRYLLKRNRLDEAFDSLCWLRGTESPDDVREELNLIQTSLVKGRKPGSWAHILGSQNVFKPLMISFGLMIFQQAIGFPSIVYFSVTIFEAAGTLINPHLSTVIIGAILVLAVAFSSFLVDSIGRRPLLLTSGICSTLPLFILGLYFYLKPTDVKGLESIEWIPLIMILVYVTTYASGWINVPWLIMTEIVPTNVVGITSGLGSSIHFFLSFVITKYFNVIATYFGMQWSFWIFGTCGILATIFVFFCVPETKMKTLEEIQLHLNEVVDSSKVGVQGRAGKGKASKNSEYQTFD